MSAELFDFEVFKTQLLGFFETTKTSVCFTDEVIAAKSPRELKKVFEENAEGIFEELGGDIPDPASFTCDECEDKEEQIETLEFELKELEQQLEDLIPVEPVGGVDNLHFRMKLKTFFEHQESLTLDEIENLFNHHKSHAA